MQPKTKIITWYKVAWRNYLMCISRREEYETRIRSIRFQKAKFYVTENKMVGQKQKKLPNGDENEGGGKT